MTKEQFKKYFKSLRVLIIISFFVFVASFIMGVFLAKASPEIAEDFFEELKKIIEPMLGLSSIYQFLFIFFKNSFTMFIIIFSGFFFGIFPIFALYFNGHILGTIFFLSQGEIPFIVFLKAILPHGIIEIPALILAAAIGLDLGKHVIRKLVLGKEINFKERFFLAGEVFLKILIPFLIMAALIESFLVPRLLGIN